MISAVPARGPFTVCRNTRDFDEWFHSMNLNRAQTLPDQWLDDLPPVQWHRWENCAATIHRTPSLQQLLHSI